MNTLLVTQQQEGGQVRLEHADEYIAHLNKETGKEWKKDFTPRLYVTDESDTDVNNPVILSEGYCWVVSL